MADTQDPEGGEQQPDRTGEPHTCSVCGVYIGFDGQYCDDCSRGKAKPPNRICIECGQRGPQEQMEAIDVSPESDYYPDIKYLCRSCSDGDSDE